MVVPVVVEVDCTRVPPMVLLVVFEYQSYIMFPGPELGDIVSVAVSVLVEEFWQTAWFAVGVTIKLLTQSA